MLWVIYEIIYFHDTELYGVISSHYKDLYQIYQPQPTRMFDGIADIEHGVGLCFFFRSYSEVTF